MVLALPPQNCVVFGVRARSTPSEQSLRGMIRGAHPIVAIAEISVITRQTALTNKISQEERERLFPYLIRGGIVVQDAFKAPIGSES